MNSVMDEAHSISAYGPARSTIQGRPLEPAELQRMQAYWNATLFLSAAMIYLRDNPLLREPLKAEHVKRRLLGHWGSDPGMSLTYIHLNRVIKKYDLNVIFLAGPGHGAPALISNVYLEGTYSEIYSDVSEDTDGLRLLFKQFSFPWDRQPLHPGDTRFDSRRRRAWLFGIARVRGGLRQPGSDRNGDGRRWRVGNPASRDRVALQQVPQSDS
jgi:XFP N-terminal domain